MCGQLYYGNRQLCFCFQFSDRVYYDYNRAAVVAVFVQQMRTDEENFPFSPSLTTLFRYLESKLYPFLCVMKMTLFSRTSLSVPVVTSDVMATSLVNMRTTAERHRRDYRILRDVVLLFDSIQKDYDVSFGRTVSTQR